MVTAIYVGITRGGRTEVGAIDPAEVSTFVHGRYVARWRKLTVRSADRTVIGAIERTENGRRTWWAQTEEENGQ